MIDPPQWTGDQLEASRQESVSQFRATRLQEPVELYSEAFDKYQGVVEDLLEATVDLSRLSDAEIVEILTDNGKLEAFRYLSGPPISEDDLKTLADVQTLSPRALRERPEIVQRLVQIVVSCLDRRRFPWISEDREATESERNAAILASAALIAHQRIQTDRRTEGKQNQEALVKAALLELGFVEAPRRTVATLGEAPKPGEFCGEASFGGRKADFIAGLWDTRSMPIECKVSNSELNSVKRLNNDAAAKAEVWRTEFGQRNVVPTAVLSGVFKLSNLVDAQQRGLTLFWAHELDVFKDWVQKTRPKQAKRRQ